MGILSQWITDANLSFDSVSNLWKHRWILSRPATSTTRSLSCRVVPRLTMTIHHSLQASCAFLVQPPALPPDGSGGNTGTDGILLSEKRLENSLDHPNSLPDRCLPSSSLSKVSDTATDGMRRLVNRVVEAFVESSAVKPVAAYGSDALVRVTSKAHTDKERDTTTENNGNEPSETKRCGTAPL
ncbi:hypothetical protein NQ176_g7043 [Zarea fungicola]|uniref:Uncharacterized protein n=1 Tax=Zarea fungicola TaxID=93591 RepID=A0ACC1N2F6_9HYPO|nr:hypothetical protein NQ176_g7043 [Lecanicillium fungicola]